MIFKRICPSTIWDIKTKKILFQTEGENISKLEKADILELTVRHLQRLQASRASEGSSSPNEETLAESRWQSGFGQCAAEACKYLAALPGESGQKLARHLASGLQSKRKLNTCVCYHQTI